VNVLGGEERPNARDEPARLSVPARQQRSPPPKPLSEQGCQVDAVMATFPQVWQFQKTEGP
jgi:hypothetical protein